MVRAHIVNRIWYWLLGRGIIQEPDDIRPDNPASILILAFLERELPASHTTSSRLPSDSDIPGLSALFDSQNADPGPRPISRLIRCAASMPKH